MSKKAHFKRKKLHGSFKWTPCGSGKKYNFTNEDIEFAQKFIEWNGIKNGIQRVDACRTQDGKLLLVELEDLNPYLSVLELDEETREVFMTDLINAFNNML